MAEVFIGLGSNLGDRERSIAAAKERMAASGKLDILAESSIDETVPVDVADQPMFLNQVVLAETELPPLDLLSLLKEIEKELGRVRTIPKGPRTIDLDILLYGRMAYRDDALVIPHPELERRPFVLKHVLELHPEAAHPVTGKPYREVYPHAENREYQ